MDNDGSAPSTQHSLNPAGDSSFDGKRQAIAEACNAGNAAAIASLADSFGGLVDDRSRRLAWPILLSLNPEGERQEDARSQFDWKTLPPHAEEDQVGLDVNRSFVFYPSNVPQEELGLRKVELSNVILEVLRTHPYLCYFQGFHDIVQVFLLVLGDERAVDAVTRFSLLRIRDFMLPSLAPALTQLQLIPAILYRADKELYSHVSGTRPYFALGATLTLYAHEIEDYREIARLFDFLLAHEAVIPVYFFTQIVLSRKKELMKIPADDSDMLHFTLSKLPRPLDLEQLIGKSLKLFREIPPTTLPFGAWRSVSSYSVLKAAGRLRPDGTIAMPAEGLEQGQELFHMQLAELRRMERRERLRKQIMRYRWAVATVGTALLIGGLSVYLQRYDRGGLANFVRGFWLRAGRPQGPPQ